MTRDWKKNIPKSEWPTKPLLNLPFKTTTSSFLVLTQTTLDTSWQNNPFQGGIAYNQLEPNPITGSFFFLPTFQWDFFSSRVFLYSKKNESQNSRTLKKKQWKKYPPTFETSHPFIPPAWDQASVLPFGGGLDVSWVFYDDISAVSVEGWGPNIFNEEKTPGRCGCWTKNRGVYPPKWMVKIMENPIKMDDLGGFHPIFKHPYSKLGVEFSQNEVQCKEGVRFSSREKKTAGNGPRAPCQEVFRHLLLAWCVFLNQAFNSLLDDKLTYGRGHYILTTNKALFKVKLLTQLHLHSSCQDMGGIASPLTQT